MCANYMKVNYINRQLSDVYTIKTTDGYNKIRFTTLCI